MKRSVLILSCLFLALAPAATLSAQDGPVLVPPVDSYIPAKGSFKMSGVTIKHDPALDRNAVTAIRKFASRLSLASGKTSPVAAPIGLGAAVDSSATKGLVFIIDPKMDADSYRIRISGKTAIVNSGGTEGIMYSLQTLRGLLPEEIYEARAADDKVSWRVPCCTISDSPANKVRAVRVDCCSQWADAGTLKSLMENMAAVKLNRLELLVSDEDCWRVSTEVYPTLAQITEYRSGKTYSSADIGSLVQYAAGLGIELVPVVVPAQKLLAEMGLDTLPEAVLAELGEMFGNEAEVIESFDADGEGVFGTGAGRADMAGYATRMWTE